MSWTHKLNDISTVLPIGSNSSPIRNVVGLALAVLLLVGVLAREYFKDSNRKHYPICIVAPSYNVWLLLKLKKRPQRCLLSVICTKFLQFEVT